MSAIPRPSPGPYFECDIPGPDVNIRIKPDVIAAIGAAVMEGLKLVPRRGLEVGGLLVGRLETGCIVVEEFEPVESEHERGPSWVLSDKDKRTLADTVARVNSAEDDMHVVGLYRSHTRSGFAPAAEDSVLMKEHFDGGTGVFLLIKPDVAGESTARFAAGEGLLATSEVFPFRGAPAAAAVERAAVPDSAAPAGAAPLRVIEHVPRLDTQRVLQGFAADGYAGVDHAGTYEDAANNSLFGYSRSRIALSLMLLLCAAVASYALAKWWTTPRAAAMPELPAPPSMGLHAKWTGTNLDLEWDRNAAPIRHASGAILSIEDGAQRKRLELAANELTQGRIQYWPTSSDVTIRLEVITPNVTVSESVRALGVPVPPSPPVAESASATPEDPAEQPKAKRRSGSQRRRGPAAKSAPR
jgi:hypothetical protein